ncbi:DUF6734 family protein [Aquimarina sp. AU474]|uniref:DUF6734 family protein n=1 Tax=Aquimarina sp. AU474 TaxID=2108529 RepID=UPI0013583DAD|nr:DUF6734 family protein [Aquimarina sp. AU474]
MTPVQLLWTKPFDHNNDKFESCIYMFLSALMIKKVYGEVHIMTDYYGKELIRQLELPYDVIYSELGQMDEVTTFVDAKILGYKMLADLLPNYLYLDYDIFITKPIKERDIIVQCDEGLNSHPYCLYHYFKDKGVKFYYEYADEDLRFLNMGLFRCTDRNIIYDYYDAYFSTIYQNQHLDFDEYTMAQLTMFLEQTYVLKTVQKHNKTDQIYEYYPRTKSTYNDYMYTNSDHRLDKIIKKYVGNTSSLDHGFYVAPSDINNIDKTGYTHLMHYKRMKEISLDVMEYAFKNYPKEFANLMTNMKYIC